MEALPRPPHKEPRASLLRKTSQAMPSFKRHIPEQENKLIYRPSDSAAPDSPDSSAEEAPTTPPRTTRESDGQTMPPADSARTARESDGQTMPPATSARTARESDGQTTATSARTARESDGQTMPPTTSARTARESDGQTAPDSARTARESDGQTAAAPDSARTARESDGQTTADSARTTRESDGQTTADSARTARESGRQTAAPDSPDSSAEEAPPAPSSPLRINDRDLPLPRPSILRKVAPTTSARRRQGPRARFAQKPPPMPCGVVEKPEEFREKLSVSGAAKLLSGKKKRPNKPFENSAARRTRPFQASKSRHLGREERKHSSYSQDDRRSTDGSKTKGGQGSLLGRVKKFLGLGDKKPKSARAAAQLPRDGKRRKPRARDVAGQTSSRPSRPPRREGRRSSWRPPSS